MSDLHRVTNRHRRLGSTLPSLNARAQVRMDRTVTLVTSDYPVRGLRSRKDPQLPA
jgi:hypothetical protein